MGYRIFFQGDETKSADKNILRYKWKYG